LLSLQEDTLQSIVCSMSHQSQHQNNASAAEDKAHIERYKDNRQTGRQTDRDIKTHRQIYRVNLKKCSNTKITISHKCVNIFVPNFAHLFTRQLHKSVLLYLLGIRQINGNANFRNKFCNCSEGWLYKSQLNRAPSTTFVTMTMHYFV